MEFEHPNLVCMSFCSVTSGMDSLLLMYHHIRVISHMTPLKGDAAKNHCKCELQAGSWSLMKLQGSPSLFFLLTLHQPESPVPQPRLQQTPPGTLQIRKGFRDHISLKIKGFFFPLYSPKHKSILLKVEREKQT